jgi:hypothetical protein
VGQLLAAARAQAGLGQRLAERFTAQFPDAQHLALGVDETDERAADPGELAGLTLERNAVMTATSVHAPPHPNNDAVVRALEGDADWRQSLELAAAVHAGGPGGEAGFLTARLAAKRALTQTGHGAWFGAFLDGTLVMVADPDDAAIRVYRSVGFTVTETQLSFVRPPA